MTDTIKISRELAEQICVELEHDNDRYMLGRELRKALATPPADAADMGGQAGEEVEVVRGEDTVFGRQYVRLDRHRRILAQHRQQAGKLAEALGRGLGAGRGTSGRIIIDAEHEQAMREALADWEKTNA